jgi:hypothetical protein
VNHVEEGIVERVSEDETSDATEAVDGAGYHDCSVRGLCWSLSLPMDFGWGGRGRDGTGRDGAGAKDDKKC